MITTVEISVEDIAESVERDEAYDVIKAIDSTQQDWEFTLGILAHFVEIIRTGVENDDIRSLLMDLESEHSFKIEFS